MSLMKFFHVIIFLQILYFQFFVDIKKDFWVQLLLKYVEFEI